MRKRTDWLYDFAIFEFGGATAVFLNVGIIFCLVAAVFGLLAALFIDTVAEIRKPQ
jgi:hypothetical protein